MAKDGFQVCGHVVPEKGGQLALTLVSKLKIFSPKIYLQHLGTNTEKHKRVNNAKVKKYCCHLREF